MSRWVKALVMVEVLVCFGPAALLLLLGAAAAPMQVYYLFTLPREAMGGALLVIGSVAAGFIGLGALACVLRHLLADRPITRPLIVFAAVLPALLPLLGYAIYSDTAASRLMGALPIAATAHLLYLSRRLFVKPSRKQLGTAGLWVSALILLAAVGIVIDRQLDLSHDELIERRQAWQRLRPAAYEYELQMSGFLLPPENLQPRRIAVEGSQVVSAVYTQRVAEILGPAASGAWTMDTVFEELLKAESRGSRIRATFNQRWGHVERASIHAAARESRWELQTSNFRDLPTRN